MRRDAPWGSMAATRLTSLSTHSLSSCRMISRSLTMKSSRSWPDRCASVRYDLDSRRSTSCRQRFVGSATSVLVRCLCSEPARGLASLPRGRAPSLSKDRTTTTPTHLILSHAQRPLHLLLLALAKQLLVRGHLEALAPPPLVVLRRALVVWLVQLADLGVPWRAVGLEVPDEDEEAGGGEVRGDLALGSGGARV